MVMIINQGTSRRVVLAVGETAEGKFQIPHIDEITHVMETITDEHHQIHDQKMYAAQYTITTASTDGHRSGIYLKTPVAQLLGVHMTFVASAKTAANLSICEAPTIAANTGTHGVTVFNHFRSSTKTSICLDNATSRASNKVTTLSEAEIAGDGTWATGTILPGSGPLTAGDGPKPAGGATRGQNEWILKPDTAYVLLLTNTTAAANDHLVEFNWYEHAPFKA